MIARIFVYLLLMIVLPCLYVDLRYLRRKRFGRVWVRMLWWLPGFCMTVFTVVLAMHPDFAPADTTALNFYLFLLGLLVVPNFVFALCSVVGLALKKWLHMRRNYGNHVGLAMVAVHWYVLIYGSTIGFNEIVVKHIDYASADLPAAFDGYRIVQFSDAHVGTYSSDRDYLLDAAVDSINAQHADMIVFTGDLQNMRPVEVERHARTLSALHAPDGVFSVLGNHDYADYLHADTATKAANCRRMVDLQRQMGWTLLRNEHRVVRRGDDSIIVAGMENDGISKRSPERGNVGKTLSGTSPRDFVLMLQHDPSCWRRKILPQCNAQLTLSGHTHGMQFELFGWSPIAFKYSEWGGLYREGARAIFVSTGLGGFLPFRFGVPGEVVVITLHRKNA
ncbi:metallophosphoesterase [Marseilla massiliensis]|uniref:metallophosphoesterase n=1 Tax=Marseilla massiliensis TaxID=1841864 RepID=UPI0030C7E060